MLKKIGLALLIAVPMVSSAWCCNNTLLKDEVQELYAKIWRGITLDKERILRSLEFLYDEKDFLDSKDEHFEQTIERYTFEIHKDPYRSFAIVCNEIYHKGNQKQQIAIEILFNSVSKEYLSQYGLEKDLELSRTLLNSQKCLENYKEREALKDKVSLSNAARGKTVQPEKKCDYPRLITLIRAVHLMDWLAFDIRFVISCIVIHLMVDEVTDANRELLRVLLINGDALHFETLETVSDGAFHSILGIQRTTFEKMLCILQKAFDLKKSHGGRPNKLSVQNMLLMALEYFGGYGTYPAMGKSYGLSQSNSYQTVKWVEAVFSKNLKITLAVLFKGDRKLIDAVIVESLEKSECCDTKLII